MFFLYDFILCPLQLTSHLPVQLQLRIRANLIQQSQIRAFFTVNCCYREFVGFPFLFPSRCSHFGFVRKIIPISGSGLTSEGCKSAQSCLTALFNETGQRKRFSFTETVLKRVCVCPCLLHALFEIILGCVVDLISN